MSTLSTDFESFVDYASFNFYVKYARKNHVVCPPSEELINFIAASSLRQLKHMAGFYANRDLDLDFNDPGEVDLYKLYINSPFASAWLRNKKTLYKRLNCFSDILQSLKILRGYYREQYALWTKQIGSNKRKQYVSEAIAEARRETEESIQEYLENTEIFMHGPAGVRVYSLADVAPTAADKKTEILTDMLLTERVALEEGREQFLVTATALPEFHSNPSKGRCSYAGGSSRQALKWIQESVLRVAYKRMNAANIKPLGFAVPEPHKDGCPHIHAAFFIKPEHVDQFLKILADVQAEISREYGIKYSLDVKTKDDLPEDKKEAKASSYCMKYVIKSFDDPAVAAWYSRDCGGEIRRCNRYGLQGYKSKFNYLYRMREQLKNHTHGIMRELGKMLCSDMRLSEKKYCFFMNYNPLLSNFYTVNENGNKVLSHVVFNDNDYYDDDGELISQQQYNLINFNRFLDPSNDNDKAAIESFKKTDEYKFYSNISKDEDDDSVTKKLTVSVCYPSGAGALPDPVITSAINDFWTDFEDEDEPISLLDL
jgi:hypothetical protein